MKYEIVLTEEDWQEIEAELKRRGCRPSSNRHGLLFWIIAEYMPNTSPCKLQDQTHFYDESIDKHRKRSL